MKMPDSLYLLMQRHTGRPECLLRRSTGWGRLGHWSLLYLCLSIPASIYAENTLIFRPSYKLFSAPMVRQRSAFMFEVGQTQPVSGLDSPCPYKQCEAVGTMILWNKDHNPLMRRSER